MTGEVKPASGTLTWIMSPGWSQDYRWQKLLKTCDTCIDVNNVVVVVVGPPRGRGQGRAHGRGAEKSKQVGRGAAGYSTPKTSEPSRQPLMDFHQNIPAAAKLPEDIPWMNNKGQVKQRQVVGSRIMIRQQPAAPPPSPEVLLITDEVLTNFQQPDKYIKAYAMQGYTLQDYTNDIRYSMIEIKYPYIVVHLGTMQLGVFDPKKLNRVVTEFMKAINQISSNSLVVFSGLVPHPMDHPRSRANCLQYSQAYVDVGGSAKEEKLQLHCSTGV